MLVDRHPEEGVRSEVGQIDAVEALRGVAVLLVILFHYVVVRPTLGPDPFVAWVRTVRPLEVLLFNGSFGVDLFFLISGFLLVLPWAMHAAHGRAAPRARDFLVRRVRRIVPAYYAHLALLFLVFLPLATSLAFIRDNLGLVAYNALAHASFLHYTTPLSSASLEVNGPLWTLAIEAQFYLLLPLLAPLFVRAPARWSVALIATSLAWRWLAANDLTAAVNALLAIGAHWQVPEAAVRHLLATQLPGYFGHFAVGMASGVAWLRLRDRRLPGFMDELWIAVLAASLALLYWLYGLAGAHHAGPYAAALLTLGAIGCAFFSVAAGSRTAARLAAVRPLLFVGRISYSAYLYHLPLLLLWGRYRVLEGSWLSPPAYLALALGLAWLSYHIVEKRFMRARAREAAAAEPLAPHIIAR